MTANSEGTENYSATNDADSKNDWHNDQLVDVTDLLAWHQMPNRVTDTEVTVEKVNHRPAGLASDAKQSN